MSSGQEIIATECRPCLKTTFLPQSFASLAAGLSFFFSMESETPILDFVSFPSTQYRDFLLGVEIARTIVIALFALMSTSIKNIVLQQSTDTEQLQSMNMRSLLMMKYRLYDMNFQKYTWPKGALKKKYFWRGPYSVSHILFFFVSDTVIFFNPCSLCSLTNFPRRTAMFHPVSWCKLSALENDIEHELVPGGSVVLVCEDASPFLSQFLS